MRYADIVLLNKCDLATRENLTALEDKIRAIRADARIISATRCAVPLPLILGHASFQPDGYPTGRCEAEHPAHPDTSHNHLASDGFGSVSFVSDQPFALDKFQHFLDAELPHEVFRGKGILWIDRSDKRYVFHLVGKRFSLDEGQWVGTQKNRLVLIGRQLDGERLHFLLAECLAPCRAAG